MNEKHSLHRRTRLLAGMPRFHDFPRRPLRSGTGPSTRHPEQACRFSERIALSPEEFDQIAQKINRAGRGSQGTGHVDPVLAASGAPSLGAMHDLLDDLAADVAGDDPPGKPDDCDDDLFIDEPALLDLGRAPWPSAR